MNQKAKPKKKLPPPGKKLTNAQALKLLHRKYSTTLAALAK